MNSIVRRTGAVVAAAGLALALASCSGGQSVADACKIAEETMTEVVTQSQADTQQALQGALQGEEVDFNAIFQPIKEALSDTQKTVTNEEVSTALDGFVTEYNSFVGVLEQVDLSGFQELSDLSDLDPSDPEAMAKIEELQEKSTELQQQAQDLQTDIQDKTEALTAASSELSELCTTN
jgi:chromosome segregation ATPase